MDGEEDILKYLNLDPDHHEKIAALIPKVKEPLVVILQIMHSNLTNKEKGSDLFIFFSGFNHSFSKKDNNNRIKFMHRYLLIL
jgi:hypothetical protein